MAVVTRNIGLSLGADICWPASFEELIKRLDLEIPYKGDRVRFAPADVTDEDAVTRAFDLAETLGPVRIVVNCAGTGDATEQARSDVA